MDKKSYRDRVGPVVCCVTTNEVERIVAKNNGMSFCNLMEAFTLLPSTQSLLGQLTFRSATRHYTLAGGLQVRYIPSQDMCPQNLEASDVSLHEAIRCRNDENIDLESLLTERTREPGATVNALEKRRRHGPWFLRWREALENSLRYSEFDSFEWPAASLIAVATTEPTGVDAALDELASRRHWPLSYRNGQFEPNGAPRHVIVIHDVSENSGADSNAALTSARSMLRAVHCHAASLLPINSKTQISTIHPHFSQLSEADIKELSRFSGELLHSAVLPSIERRVASLHLNVTNARKGVRNVLKSWLRRPREDGRDADSILQSVTDPSNGKKEERVRYSHECIENQIRSLGDAAYAMRDSETAISAYRLARDDFKSDRAHKHLGAANEMLARSLWTIAKETTEITNSEERQLRRDAIQAADASTAGLAATAREEAARLATANRTQKSPQRTATHAGRMLTRASLVAADIHASWPSFEDSNKSPFASPSALQSGSKVVLKQQEISTSGGIRGGGNKHRRSPAERAADALVGSAQFETNLNAAVLYEQAAWRFRSGGLYRKCALHLVMAGHRYRACGEDTHALECYAASRDAYAESYRVVNKRQFIEHKRIDALDHHHVLALFSPQHTALELLQGQELASSIALMYRPPGWARIDEHVEHALGRQLEALGHHALALRCTLSLLASAKAPPERHAALLASFVSACVARPEALKRAVEFGSQSSGRSSTNDFFGGGGETEEVVKAALLAPPLGSSSTNPLDTIVVPGLPVPLVLDDAVCLRTSDEATEGRADDRLRWAIELGNQLAVEANAVVNGETYLEEDSALGATSSARMAFFNQPNREADAARSRAARAAIWPRWCATAEPIEVDIVFRNAFAAPVELNDVHLVCTMDPDHDFARDPISAQSSKSITDFDNNRPKDQDDTFVQLLRDLAAARDRGERMDELYLAERVNVTLPPGGAGSGGSGALVRLRCGAVCNNGTLRIVGVRWRLSHQVWGAHAFVRRGPRLFRTRVERARRLRALDASLALHVIGDAPRLEARLAIFDHKEEPKWLANSALAPRGGAETLLHGQTRRGCLELRNFGRASASDILIRSSGPWLALGLAQSNMNNCATETRLGNLASAIGPSGLLWRAVTSQNKPLALAPGEVYALPIILRARGAGGKEPLRLVVQYQPTHFFSNSTNLTPAYVTPPKLWPEYNEHDPEKPDVIPPRSQRAEGQNLARRAPLALDVCVLPALSATVASVVRHASPCVESKKYDTISGSLAPDVLEITASASPVYNQPEQSILALQLTNYRSAGPITVLAVRILDEDDMSNAFDIYPLELRSLFCCKQPSIRNTQVAVNKAIGWNEEFILQLRVVPSSPRSMLSKSDKNDDPAMDLLRVERKRVTFEKKNIQKHKTRENKAVYEPRSIASIRREREATASSAAGPAKPKPSKSNTLTETRYISLLVAWEAIDDEVDDDDENSIADTPSSVTTKKIRHGQQHILHVPILESADTSCPIALTLEYPPIAAASFIPQRKVTLANVTPILIPPRVAIPVKLRLVHRAPRGTQTISIRVELFDDNHLDLRWLGQKSKLFPALEAGDSTGGILETEVSVTRPGIYDLNRIRCTIYDDSSLPSDKVDLPSGRSFGFDVEYLLEVRNLGTTISSSSGWGPVERDELFERLLNIPSSAENQLSLKASPIIPDVSVGSIATAPSVVTHGPPRPTIAIPLPPGTSHAGDGIPATATIVPRPPTGLAAAPPVASRRQVVTPGTAKLFTADGPLFPRRPSSPSA